MKLMGRFIFCFLLFSACVKDNKTVFDEFKDLTGQTWHWNDSKPFTFEIKDSTYTYNLSCGLRISGAYKYSNIWLIYTLEGQQLATKNQFQIQLSDNTGKWLGKGMSNLISYEQVFMQNIKFKAGKYTLRFNQNMRDEKLADVSDIGIKIYKVTKIY